MLTAYDGRETAPAAAKPDRFLDATASRCDFRDAIVGGRSVGVPGVLRMLELAHRQYGKLQWARLFVPAIALAENGFTVSARLHAAIADRRIPDAGARAGVSFSTRTARRLPPGNRCATPRCAATLKRIAAGGAGAFYEGDIARDIVDTVNARRAQSRRHHAADLANYKAKVREPVCGAYRAYRVCGMPPPSSGGITVLQMLGMLEPFDMRSAGARLVAGACTSSAKPAGSRSRIATRTWPIRIS